jgi:hypothetical protein
VSNVRVLLSNFLPCGNVPGALTQERKPWESNPMNSPATIVAGQSEVQSRLCVSIESAFQTSSFCLQSSKVVAPRIELSATRVSGGCGRPALDHAQRLLVTTDDAILNLALDSGFQSLRLFNEAFKAACGCSPRDYRKMHRLHDVPLQQSKH